jgi:hypothetical protein
MRDVYDWATLITALVGVAVVALSAVFAAWNTFLVVDQVKLGKAQVDLGREQLQLSRTQLDDGRRLAREAREASRIDDSRQEKLVAVNEKLAAASTVQADASAAQAKTAEGQLTQSRSATRSWIGTVVQPASELAAGQPFRIKIQQLIYGNSPAFNVMSHSRVDIFQSIALSSMPLPKCYDNCGVSTLVPGMTSDSNLAFSPEIIDAAMVERIKEKEYYIVVRVRVDYIDSQGDEHRNIVCVYYIDGIFSSCPAGNEVD